MKLGIITGSGTHALPGFVGAAAEMGTPHGPVEVARGSFHGVDAVHISRHGAGHTRLSNHVNHRANIWALRELGVNAAVGCTACGAVDETVELGSLIVFEDLHFPANRLPDGSLCTFFQQAGDPARAHWILHRGPFSAPLRDALARAAEAAGVAVRDGGTYGHVDGPRFNTPAEIAQLARCGVTAVSQTGGPETVLCGELEIPFALVGFATDYANEVIPGDPTPVSTLVELMGRSSDAFAGMLEQALGEIAAAVPDAAGTVYRLAPR